ncbi:RidA family protein [Sphingobacterium daejeonense]|uniref:RidA family protein n=1 Tax=Sphingobacterium daejeonense TaxID=371142 RepID=UPI0010C3EBB6|nr:RidA family protein [Sphingobacterium daejeonense]VTP99592.1 Uncharacterised protein [Sphingobacterium daejeonense]
MYNADEQFEKLGLTLPPAPAPLGVYKPYLIDGKYLYLSGHGPVQDDKSLIIGRIGSDMDADAGKIGSPSSWSHHAVNNKNKPGIFE